MLDPDHEGKSINVSAGWLLCDPMLAKVHTEWDVIPEIEHNKRGQVRLVN